MRGQTEITPSSPCGDAPVVSIEAGPLLWDSGDEALGRWRGHVNASAVHPTVKRQPCRLDPNLRGITLLLVASLAAAFVLLRCYRQLTVVISLGKRPLRSLADGKEAGRETECMGADWAIVKSPAGASDGLELAVQRRTESVVRRIIQATKDCASVAALLPSTLPLRVADLFLGFGIQEVAALSVLLGRQFEEQKAEVLQTTVQAAQELKWFCRQRTTRGQQQHASRLVRYALDLWAADPEVLPLANEVRLQMLEELLELQETALGLIENAVLSVLNSQSSGKSVPAELAYDLTEELKRIIYTRRTQVFKSKHLSHSLRDFEERLTRGNIVHGLDFQDLDRKPQQTLEEQLAELIDGEEWVRFPLKQTQSTLLEASVQKQEPPAKQGEPEGIQSSATGGAQARKMLQRSNFPKFEVPPRFRGMSRFSTQQARDEWAQAGLAGTHTGQTEQTPGGLDPSYKTQRSQAGHALPHQALATASSSGQVLPETGRASPELSLGPIQSKEPWNNSRCYGTAASPATRPQPTAPIAEALEAYWQTRGDKMPFEVPREAAWSPWSSVWAPSLPLPPQLPPRDSTSSTTAHMAHGREGVSSHEPPHSMVWPGPVPPSSFQFTTPQSIARGAVEMLFSLRPQTQPTGRHLIARVLSRPSFDSLSMSTSSLLMNEQAIQSTGMSSSSGSARSREYLYSLRE
ncbi:hypothetical protein, conserved [Eimeria acervulina]|uniref:Uncharacterized protein n=1 Tax=Eimeria acervulina TaxID=5801 RepID=U6GDU1_EIMAC|nr:hypothetical protein, conserved [Eimeria acervulina]CDI76739.1 hypothetical protein, conserved [Eimeria acervulina]